MEPDPDYRRLVTTLWGGQADRVPILEELIEPEIKSAYLGKPVATIADDMEFWYQAGYDCIPVFPGSPTMWFYIEQTKPENIVEDAHSMTGYRPWASVGKGLIQDWTGLERFPVPTLDDIDFSYFEEAKRSLPPGMGLIGAWGDVFTYTWDAMGFAEFCYALYERENLVAYIFEQLGRLAMQVCEAMISYEVVKAIWWDDDIAYKGGFLVSPDVYRRYVFPWLRQAGDLCRRANLPLIFHSDGVLWEVMEDLIDCGVNALHPIDPTAMDIREMKRRYGHRLCLIGNVNVDTLARGTPDQVKEEVKVLLCEVAPGGGYCLGSSNTIPNYVKVENYVAMIETARQLGRYPIAV